jgi:hypothetical protein
MAVYLVTWDLNKKRADYAAARQKLVEHMSRYQHIKDPGLDSVWFISSDLSANGLEASIRASMGNEDRLIVTRIVQGQHQGWLHESIWAWINARV